MSIAVSTVYRPSRILRYLVGVMVLFAILVSGLIGFGMGDLPLYPRLMIAGFCLFAALPGVGFSLRKSDLLSIDISGVGQIRVAVYKKLASEALPTGQAGPDLLMRRHEGEIMYLMHGSTLWPQLLLLRLQSEKGQLCVLPILPDCVAPKTFRALSVALRWIALRSNSGEGRIL